MLATFNDIEMMKKAGSCAAQTLASVKQMIQPGVTTDQINDFVARDTAMRGGVCAPLNYKGFPKHVCTSVNNTVCHGIPDTTLLKEGDIINVDVTTIKDGYYGDTSATYYVGKVGADAKHVTETARVALQLGISKVREGARTGDIGAVIQEFVEKQGCSVVRSFGGHGIGKKFHEDPFIAHFGRAGDGMRLKAGMCFTIEPMVNMGGYEVKMLDDGWTVVTVDGSLSAQFEHTILVTKTGCEVLTQFK